MPRLKQLPPYEPEGIKIAEKIIKCLILGMAIPALFVSPFGLYNIVRGGIKYYFRKKDFNREIKRLQKRGYIALTKTPDGFLIRLLKKGQTLQRKLKIGEIKLPTEKKWDGRWRFFIFDIPEKQRYGRDFLRRKLKELGMYNMQRSVFAYPHDCRKELEFIAESFKLTKYTSYIEAASTDIDRELYAYFKKILS